jgi:cytochrome c oxidase assembly factor CtaG
VVFFAGVATILLVGCSFLGVYDDAYFWLRAVQNTVLLMVTPMLLALGAPIRLAADTLPPRVRGPLAQALHSRPARVLTFPLLVTVALVVPLLVLYLSPLYALTLRSAVASGVAGTVVALTGFVYYWSRFRVDPTPRADSHLVTLWITVVEMSATRCWASCSGSARSSRRPATRPRRPASTRASTRRWARASSGSAATWSACRSS